MLVRGHVMKQLESALKFLGKTKSERGAQALNEDDSAMMYISLKEGGTATEEIAQTGNRLLVKQLANIRKA
jgi:hypothetical protein